MNIPKSIRVGGLPIKIVLDDLSDDECFGYYSHDRKAIFIDRSLKGTKLMETMRHELMEASLCIGGPAWNEGNETEGFVRCMENIFFPTWDRFQKRMQRPHPPNKP